MESAHRSVALSSPHRGGFGQLSAYRVLEIIGYALFGVFIFLIGFDVSEPAPYDLMAVPVILLWLALGVRMPQHAVFFVSFLLVYCLGLLSALIPHLDRPPSVWWVMITLYLTITAAFFVMFFSDDTQRRVELTLKALLASCIVAAIAGVAGYFDLFGTAELFTGRSRASGTFEDPNVFGTFLIFGVLYLVSGLITGEGGRPLLSLLTLPLLLAGIFLSFSRGSWAGLVVGMAVLLFTTFATNFGFVRRRIALFSLVSLVVGAISVAGLLTLEEVRSMFEVRAQVTQDYDEGVTGRFGNQLRAIPMLMERPNGFGPLRFRAAFGFEPHNSYIGTFANGGWISGFAFIILMLGTTYVGLRLCFRPSPYRRHAQIICAMQLTFFVQSFQIDIDHWRHAFLVWGMIWGLEVARMRWLAGQRRATAFVWADGLPPVAVAGPAHAARSRPFATVP